MSGLRDPCGVLVAHHPGWLRVMPISASRSPGLARTSEGCVGVRISQLRRLLAAQGSCITNGSRPCCSITMKSTPLRWLTVTQGGCITDGSRLSCDSYMDLRTIRYGRRIARLGCMLRVFWKPEREDQRIQIGGLSN